LTGHEISTGNRIPERNIKWLSELDRDPSILVPFREELLPEFLSHVCEQVFDRLNDVSNTKSSAQRGTEANRGASAIELVQAVVAFSQDSRCLSPHRKVTSRSREVILS
jgi:hypothetical protein